MRALCIFCGSSSGNDPAYSAVARHVGAFLASSDITLVYGGGRVGLMGSLADAVLEAGGRVIGVIPQMLIDKEVGHAGLTELHIVRTMTERKLLMGELSDAFVALPGGIGTMDELFEVWTWSQLELHHKPCGVLNHNGYYDSLIAFLDHAVHEGFLHRRHRAMFLVDSEIETLVERLFAASGA